MHRLFVIVLVLLASGCTIPMTPDEFREAGKAGRALATY